GSKARSARRRWSRRMDATSGKAYVVGSRRTIRRRRGPEAERVAASATSTALSLVHALRREAAGGGLLHQLLSTPCGEHVGRRRRELGGEARVPEQHDRRIRRRLEGVRHGRDG